MTERDVEARLKNAAERLSPDVLENILANCNDEHLPVYIIQPRKHKTWLRTAGAFAAVFALIFTSNWLSLSKVNSLIMLDVNPSIEIRINKNDRVLEAVAKNGDALKILDNMDLKNIHINVAINALVGSMLKYGYIQENANSVLLSVESENGEKSAELQRNLSNSISQQLNMLNGAVLSQNLSGDSLIQSLADENQISYGKAALVQKILNENAHLVFEDLARLSVNELVLLVGSKNIRSEDMESKGNASDTAYIGDERAAQIALEHAGITSGEADGLRTELDYDGIMLYDVEFYYDGAEYDYEIDAVSGAIVEYDRESGDRHENKKASANIDNIPQSYDKDDFIGEDKAAEIASGHAGIEVYSKLKAELDKDDGLYIYEVEFETGSTEYEYEINAVTGEIISWESED